MRLLRGLGCLLFLAAVAGPTFAAQEEQPAPDEGIPILKPDDAERLFLAYIYDPSHLMRNCLFLGGVRIGAVSYRKIIATTEIRYRIQCVQEEIDLPPLDRTLKEDFLYRFVTDHWEILGRATEVSPAQKSATPGAAVPAAPDPTRGDRKAIAEMVLAWVVLGTPPPGITSKFPGGMRFPKTGEVLVSNENLAGLDKLSLPGREVLVLTPDALLQRTILMEAGVWLRFESLDIVDKSARAVIGVATAVTPDPGPGQERVRSLARVRGEFVQRQTGWIMTRFSPL